MATGWLAILRPANQKPGLKMILTNMDFDTEFP